MIDPDEGPDLPAKCKICGKEFERTRGRQVICKSPACRKADHIARNKRYDARRAGDMLPEFCAFCGRAFIPRHPEMAFCSDMRCRRDRKRIAMTKWRESQARKRGERKRVERVTYEDCENMT